MRGNESSPFSPGEVVVTAEGRPDPWTGMMKLLDLHDEKLFERQKKEVAL